MRVFVTGAAGFNGRAVVQELLNNGHQVLGLARSDSSAEILTKLGAEVQRGDLEDLESLKTGAKSADGVIHLAFATNFGDFIKATEVDRAAIQAMGEAIAGTGKPLVYSSGTLATVKGQLATEDMESDKSMGMLSERTKSEDLIYALSKEKQIRGSVVRLSPTTHGPGDIGFVPGLMNMAKKNGFVTYVGDGSSRWPAVHVLDAAILFRLALEKGKAGRTYHAVAEQGVPTKSTMEVIGKNLQLPVESKSVDEAAGMMGFLAHLLALDNFVSSQKTQKELGWKPTQPGLLADMEATYFSGDMKSNY